VTDTTEQTSRLEEFFRKRSDDPDSVKVTGYEPITGGYSRAMARVWVSDASGDRAYVVRSDPPPGQSILDTDRTEEWALLTALEESGHIPMPAPRWFDPAGEELGSPSIVVDMLDAPSLVALSRQCDESEHEGFAMRFSALAAQVHTFDPSKLPDHIEVPESWDAYIDSRIQKWVDAEQANVWRNSMMRLIAAWLSANKPPPVPLTFVHGDFQIANVLVGKDGSFSLIDWELAHIGDPREDLGWAALASVTQPPDLIAPGGEAFYRQYRDLTGLSEDQVNPTVTDYFVVLAAVSVFVPVIEQLAFVARGESTAMMVAYMSNAVAGMHEVMLKAMARYDEATGGAR
jgi:aminoglycoside phosphotransferase (APT) family kinase protein